MKVQEKKSQKHHIRWMLVCYDALIYLMSAILLLILYGGMDKLTTAGIAGTDDYFGNLHSVCANDWENI